MSCSYISNFDDFVFSPSKLLELPREKNVNNFVRRNIKGVIFSPVLPTPVTNPKLVSFSEDVFKNILNLDPVVSQSQEFVDFVAGNRLLNSSNPLAHRYGGYQFGYWAMQLGDGRAVLIGEIDNGAGRWELQLKGAGKTPYSRDGDGRAVLRSSIREFLCSEAMFHLGIPTSRAGAIIVSDNKVMRDILYDGNPKFEPVSVVLRIAPSWFRIGSLEILTKNDEIDLLKALIDFIIKTHFPEIEDGEDRIFNFISKISRMTSDLVISWQAVGFTHGVLNTDNMSLLGITIDYGPFGFMEEYDPLYVPNYSDTEARYSYGNQISVILYNLTMLVRALFPVLSKEQIQKASVMLQSEKNYIYDKLEETLSKKLGLKTSEPSLVKTFLQLLEDTRADFVMTFREMGETPLNGLKKPCCDLWALKRLASHPEFSKFVDIYSQKLLDTGQTDADRMKQMCSLNPRYVLRNWMAQDAIKQAEEGDYTLVNKLLKILTKPFTKQEEAESLGYALKPPSWAHSLAVSCSS
ncbi:hypothetical protein AAG570_010531 [Ranatra chinensis]|uniref:Selenoprotein O n=1 Tax=Ranatra chinensis TaxID=642074 RepID=A0ABD0YMU5_9HEMI